MSSSSDEPLGRVDDEVEEAVESSTVDGPAAEGEYDPAQGSPEGEHPTGAGFPDEAPKDGSDERRRTEQDQ